MPSSSTIRWLNRRLRCRTRRRRTLTAPHRRVGQTRADVACRHSLDVVVRGQVPVTQQPVRAARSAAGPLPATTDQYEWTIHPRERPPKLATLQGDRITRSNGLPLTRTGRSCRVLVLPAGREGPMSPADRLVYNSVTMKTVGRRRFRAGGTGTLQQTLAAVRGTGAVVPRGVYRFTSFEEADAWMTRTMARTHARLRSKTSSGSAAR